MAWGPFFLSAGTLGVHLDDCAVEGNGFDPDLYDVPSLQGLEDLIQDAALGGTTISTPFVTHVHAVKPFETRWLASNVFLAE